MTRADSPDRTSVHIRRALDGDGHSLSWLVTRLSPVLVAQASHRLGPRLRSLYDPEDLVHDAWMVLLRRIEEFDEEHAQMTPVLLRFLGTTILYKVNNLVRKHATGDVEELRAASLLGPDADIDPRSGVVTHAIRTELRNSVLECIDALDEQDKEVLLLRGIEQVPINTVAMLLGITKQGVSMRYARALERLRKELPGSVFDEL